MSDSDEAHNFIVRTPKFFHFDQVNTNQIQEFLPNGINLKDYVLRHYTAPTPQYLQYQCHQLGKALGRWFNGFVKWGAKQNRHRQIVAQNTFGQDVKHMINFSWLRERIKDFPVILDDAKDILGEVEQMAVAERQDVSKHQIIHGDFWTGK